MAVWLLLLAGGGLYLAAAPASPATATMSAKTAYAAATTTIKVALISAPWGVVEEMLPVLGLRPGPLECVGRVPGFGVELKVARSRRGIVCISP